MARYYTHRINTTDHPLAGGQAPEWASGWGQDQDGVWVEFSIHDVVQKMRWIRAGNFVMGSPDDEPGRFKQEEPQHTVTLSDGFWLFDTPCTQELWQAVTGNNPSRFQSPKRPVEQVSWDTIQQFLEQINSLLPGLNLGLPTEAQWEYSCRAGTRGAIYDGDFIIEGDNNAPTLDPISWYGGNSGQDFDLDNGLDSSGWHEKQYSHKKAGTRDVGLKKANPWGLYDMLGNVFEWCLDGQRTYQDRDEDDPCGPLDEGGSRVIRGGSWYGNAWYVRSAFRDAYVPGDRRGFLGFRCARVQKQEKER